MVDSIVDNLSLRTQRRADIRLDISLSSTSLQLNQLIEGIKKILDQPEINSRLVVLNEIGSNAYIIIAEYYCNPIPIASFNAVKQFTNLQIIALLESLHVELAGLSTDVKIIKAPTA